MGDLSKIGLILALISGILAIVLGIVHIIGGTISILSLGTVVVVGGNQFGGVIEIVMGIILVLLYQDRIHISDLTILAVIILVIGLLGGGILAVLGGILILIDILFVTGGNTRTYRKRRTYRTTR